MAPEKIAALSIVAVAVSIALGDVLLWAWYGTVGTISGALRGAGAAHPLLIGLVAFLMGCLFGHLFLSPAVVVQ